VSIDHIRDRFNEIDRKHVGPFLHRMFFIFSLVFLLNSKPLHAIAAAVIAIYSLLRLVHDYQDD
jgi:hypothetical protein